MPSTTAEAYHVVNEGTKGRSEEKTETIRNRLGEKWPYKPNTRWARDIKVTKYETLDVWNSPSGLADDAEHYVLAGIPVRAAVVDEVDTWFLQIWWEFCKEKPWASGFHSNGRGLRLWMRFNKCRGRFTYIADKNRWVNIIEVMNEALSESGNESSLSFCSRNHLHISYAEFNDLSVGLLHRWLVDRNRMTEPWVTQLRIEMFWLGFGKTWTSLQRFYAARWLRGLLVWIRLPYLSQRRDRCKWLRAERNYWTLGHGFPQLRWIKWNRSI